jgi:hypothetical protein
MFISDDGVDVYIQCIQRKAVFGKRKFTGCFAAINFDSCRSLSDPEEPPSRLRLDGQLPEVKRPFKYSRWMPGHRPQEPFEGVPLDRAKVGFVEGGHRTGSGHFRSFADL